MFGRDRCNPVRTLISLLLRTQPQRWTIEGDEAHPTDFTAISRRTG